MAKNTDLNTNWSRLTDQIRQQLLAQGMPSDRAEQRTKQAIDQIKSTGEVGSLNKMWPDWVGGRGDIQTLLPQFLTQNTFAEPTPPAPAEAVPDVEAEAQARAQKLRDVFEKMQPKIEAQGRERIGSQFSELRRKLAGQEASLGRLRSPIAAVQENKLAGQEGLALSDLIGGLSQQRVSGEMDIAKTIESLLAGERAAKQRSSEFGQELAMRGRTLAQEAADKAEERRVALQVGQMQAAASKPKDRTWVDEAMPFLNLAAGIGGRFIPTTTINKYA